MGGKSSSSSASSTSTVTNNADKRIATDSGVGVSGDGNSVINNVNSTDAVKFIAQAGSDFATGAQKAVVELSDTGTRANLEGWNSTIDASTSLLDKLTDKTFSLMEKGLTQTNSSAAAGVELASKAMAAYEPSDSKQMNTVAIVAAAGVAAVLLLGKK